MTSLEGRTALVTGGARRVGAAIAAAVEAAGARVFITSRKGRGENVIRCDLSSRHGVECVLAELPPVDLLVNSAANFISEPFGSISFDNFNETFAVNVARRCFCRSRSAARCSRAASAASSTSPTSPRRSRGRRTSPTRCRRRPSWR